jgi:hypothetical protein
MTSANDFVYTVVDVGRALNMSDRDVRRVLRRLKVPKEHGLYTWNIKKFRIICGEVRVAAFPYEGGRSDGQPSPRQREHETQGP